MRKVTAVEVSCELRAVGGEVNVGVKTVYWGTEENCYSRSEWPRVLSNLLKSIFRQLILRRSPTALEGGILETRDGLKASQNSTGVIILQLLHYLSSFLSFCDLPPQLPLHTLQLIFISWLKGPLLLLEESLCVRINLQFVVGKKRCTIQEAMVFCTQ